MFGICWGGTPLKVAGRHPRRLKYDFVTILYRFGSPFGVPGGALWEQFWRMFFETDLFKICVSDIRSDSEKEHRAGLYFLLSLGGFPLCERTNICCAIFEV